MQGILKPGGCFFMVVVQGGAEGRVALILSMARPDVKILGLGLARGLVQAILSQD